MKEGASEIQVHTHTHTGIKLTTICSVSCDTDFRSDHPNNKIIKPQSHFFCSSEWNVSYYFFFCTRASSLPCTSDQILSLLRNVFIKNMCPHSWRGIIVFSQLHLHRQLQLAPNGTQLKLKVLFVRKVFYISWMLAALWIQKLGMQIVRPICSRQLAALMINTVNYR